MDFCDIRGFVGALVIISVVMMIMAVTATKDNAFDVNYDITWGNDHVTSMDQGKEIKLAMDIHSGAGFASKGSYVSGFFHMRIKLPEKDSAGIVTAFYLTSDSNNHDELDFEFLGNIEGKPITLQTNIFINGRGNREQRLLLWFNPSADFHSYKILWNQHQIVFYVDNIPIRVFKNNITKHGIEYPKQAMQVEGSLWNGDSWATDGGQTKTNWSHAPFIAHFQQFSIDGCLSADDHNYGVLHCYSSQYWWNWKKFWNLDAQQQKDYEVVRSKYINYDYCFDESRFSSLPLECI